MSMTKFSRFYTPAEVGFKLKSGKIYVDYKNVEDVRRLLSANGKLLSRQRTRLSAQEQRVAAIAVKRARVMALITYDSQIR